MSSFNDELYNPPDVTEGETRVFKIHYRKDGYEDELIINGNSIEEIREEAFRAGEIRGWDPKNCWSEEIGASI